MSRQQVLLTGTGGQGLILAAIMLAEAAVLAGHNVVQSQSYGPEARGGASKAEVIISDEVIHYPKVQHPGLVLAMSQEAYRKYGLNLDEEAILVVDSTYVPEVKPRKKNFYAFPITRITRSRLGGEQSANVAALGVVAALGNLVTREEVRQAVSNRAPKGTAERNLEALEIGWQLGMEAAIPADNRNAV